MTIAKRLMLLLAVPLVVLLALGLFVQFQLKTVEDRARFVAELQIPSLSGIAKVTRTFAEMRIHARGYIMAPSPEEGAMEMEKFNYSEREFNGFIGDYDVRLISDERDRLLFENYRSSTREWVDGARTAMTIWAEGKNSDAFSQIYGPLKEQADQIGRISADWVRHNEVLAETAADHAFAGILATRERWWYASAGTVLLMGWLAFVTFRRIALPIRALENSVRLIAAGDYAKEVPFTGATDETGSLARSIAHLKEGAAQTQSLLTQTKQQEAELQRINFQADGALDLSKAGYWHVPLDDSGWYNSSERAVRIFGDVRNPEMRYTLAHWAAQVAAGDPEVAKATAENFAAAVAGTVPAYDTTYAYKRPVDGRVVWIHALGKVVRDANGKPTDMYGVAQDVTDSKLAELAMKESEQRIRETEQFFRSVLELAPDGLMVVNATGVIQLANAQCEKLFGYTREELVGQPVDILVPDSIRGHHAGMRAGFHRAPQVRAMGTGRELKGKRKDGSLFAIEIGLSPLPAREKHGAEVAVSIRDITERKQQEVEILSAKQKAEEATQMKSMFLANMSHEIRTPMNAIIGLSHLALRTPLNTKQRDYISKVHNAGTSLLAIINDILDFSKIEAGKIDIESTDFKLDDVITSVTVVTGQKANEKGLEFLAHTAPGMPAVLLGDPLRLGQVITNLVNNAIKFTERGEVHLHAELLESTGEKCQLKFSIRDTGVGMSREQSARLFQPFTQADMSTTRKHGGTGLGLTISRRLVELMGGQISLESEPGVGTTFTFTVWLGIGQQRGSGKVIPEKLTKLRTLIVDDNAAAREILDELLDGIVELTDVVSSGAEAIAAVKQHDGDAPYDVVFMDWRMEGLDGLQAARAIKNDGSLKHQPAIVLVTAFGREEVREEAERLKLEGFLVKPVTRSMVVDALVNVFMDSGDQAAAVHVAKHEGRRLDGMRVLLAEDNEINQQIACELLEGVGAKVTVAVNGREAVARLTENPGALAFDAVLMDLQMPIMGGHEATAKLRAEARFALLPIIAMTAHATLEERQRCLAAGMNEHITKPIDPRLLFETLGRFHRPAEAASDPAPGVARQAGLVEIPAIDGLDRTEGLARVAGNQSLYVKLLRTFHGSQASVAEQITAALQQGDMATAERLAHSLKGVAGNLGAKAVQTTAGEVEKRIRENSPAHETQAAVADLAAALGPLVAQLADAFATTAAAETPVAVPTADPAQTRAALAELTKLLEEFDAGSNAFIEKNSLVLQPAFTPADWNQFTRHAQSYAFSDALELLQRAGKPPTG